VTHTAQMHMGCRQQHTCFEVLLVRTISSRGMMCAGLKKWAPMTRSWDLVFEPMSSMSMVEVLVDSMQSGPHTLSKSAATFLANL
jgi:hypothetical protein